MSRHLFIRIHFYMIANTVVPKSRNQIMTPLARNKLKGHIEKFIWKALALPPVFELQQRLCNNYDAVHREFRDYLEGEVGKRILDIGCSTGNCGAAIVDMRRNKYYGVDVKSEYVELAARRYPQGHFMTMDARYLRFDNERFDVAMFIGVLHHMDDQLVEACVGGVSQVLCDESVLLVAEPVFTDGWILSNLLLSLDRGQNIRTCEGYRQLFKDLRVERQRFFKFSLHRFCSFVLRKATG